MTENIKIAAEERTEKGSTAARKMRREGGLPCILLGTDGQTESLLIDMHDFEITLQRQGSDNLLSDMEVDGKTRKAILKEIQFDPLSGRMLHADFAEISMTEKMQVQIHIELMGDAPGITAGGLLDQSLRELEVNCLPADIVDSIRLDIEAMEIGDTLSVSDIKLDPKFELITALDASVVSIHAPRVAEDGEGGAAAEGEEGAESDSSQPELIGEKKDDDAGEGESEG